MMFTDIHLKFLLNLKRCDILTLYVSLLRFYNQYFSFLNENVTEGPVLSVPVVTAVKHIVVIFSNK